MENLQVVYLAPTSLKPYENNTRKHSPRDIEAIKDSIMATGFNDPIGIWGDENLIIEGHGRQIAAIEMGLESVPCIRLDHLNETQRKEYAIKHNRTAELSEWNFDKLREEIAALEIDGVDMTGLGFNFDDEVDEEGEPKEGSKKDKAEVPFSEILGEANNYLILQFKTDIDWLNACTVFDIGTAQSYSTRKDGVITEKMHRYGTARVLDGAKAIKKILGEI